VLALRLFVADVNRSKAFYRDTFGFGVLENGRTEVSVDAGPTLQLQREPVRGLVRALKGRNRLRFNWFVMTVDDLDKEVRNLRRRGVRPNPIETSDIGRIASFTDPDGYTLAYWKPSRTVTPNQPINFYPSLDRILAAQ
jgi:predicted enzyme related to lactoylglutathione lyase